MKSLKYCCGIRQSIRFVPQCILRGLRRPSIFITYILLSIAGCASWHEDSSYYYNNEIDQTILKGVEGRNMTAVKDLMALLYERFPYESRASPAIQYLESFASCQKRFPDPSLTRRARPAQTANELSEARSSLYYVCRYEKRAAGGWSESPIGMPAVVLSKKYHVRVILFYLYTDNNERIIGFEVEHKFNRKQ